MNLIDSIILLVFYANRYIILSKLYLGDLLKSKTLESLEKHFSLRQAGVERDWDEILQDEPKITEQFLRYYYASVCGKRVGRTSLYDDFLKKFWSGCGITLVDFKLEFGKTSDGAIILADEISPDTSRLWDTSTGKKLDKDRFRRDLGDVEAAYTEVMSRLEKHI